MADREVRLREDRAQLLREMERLLTHTKESVSAMADSLIKPAVKRIIARNEQMSAELGFQVNQTRALNSDNEGLLAQIRDLKCVRIRTQAWIRYPACAVRTGWKRSNRVYSLRQRCA